MISILTVNSSFPEIDHLSAALAEAGLLSCYVRPYVNKGRKWETLLKNSYFLGDTYNKTIGRRTLISGIARNQVIEESLLIDFLMAFTVRLPIRKDILRSINSILLGARTKNIAKAAAKKLKKENITVASWSVAELVFKKAMKRGGLNILNHSFAHHAFVEKFAKEEAEREPEFAGSLKNCSWPNWLKDRFDSEINMADKILVGSSFAKDSFISQNVKKEKIEIKPYGVDTFFFSPHSSTAIYKNKFRILFVGQIGQRKGISYLFRAYKRFQGPGTSLTLVGQLQGEKSAFAPWRSIFKHVPHCPKSDLLRIYLENDVFLFPTLIEGMGLVILEAMSCGLPVITTPNGPGDIVRNGIDGYIVPPRDVDALVDCLVKLRKDPELCIWMGKNARLRALHFSWDSYRKDIVSTIQRWSESILTA